MSSHDPRRIMEDIRNHLAARDRRITFLFGAGTSSAVNVAPPPPAGEERKHVPLIPGIDGLTEVCRKAVAEKGESHAAAWDALLAQCKQAGQPGNVESILSNVRVKIDAIGEGESLVGLDCDGLRDVECAICSGIAGAAMPAEDRIPKELPHDNFSAWVRKVNRVAPLEIFTTNYDILFERAFESSRVPIFDGFVGAYTPFFCGESLEDEQLLPPVRWVRLWKLHGSVNWRRDSGAPDKRIVRTQPSASGEMILPSHRKYDESRKQPYMAYMDRLSRVLNAEHSLLITCGYSFGDQHINEILFGALDNRSTANVVALQFSDLKAEDALVVQALRRPTLTLIGPNGGVISGVFGVWQLTQPVDRKTCAFMDSGFDSNASPEDEGSPAAGATELNGRMRLGDFNWFCRFLKDMGPDIQ